MSWIEDIETMTAKDWQLYSGEDEAAKLLNKKLIKSIKRQIELFMEDIWNDIPSAANGVRLDMQKFMAMELKGTGANDTEPQWVLIDKINEIFGTTLQRWG